MDPSSTGRWIRKFRFLVIALIFSGALNIGFIAAYFSSWWTASQEHFSVAVPKPAQGDSSREVALQGLLAQMEKLSFSEQLSYLTNREPVEAGYLKRDLGLAALVAFHHFDLGRALSHAPLQKRVISLRADRQVEIYPGLQEEQFEAVIRFAYEEKWPLTAEGIFKLLKKTPDCKDPSLLQAFLVTPQFYALNALFQKSDAPQELALLVRLMLDGPWELLSQFVDEQALSMDFTPERRRKLLLSYLGHGSAAAAHLLLHSDYSYVAKRLEDRELLLLLPLLGSDAERLCMELLHAPRTDAVWRAAAEKLYQCRGESIPAPFDLKAAVARFVPRAIETAPPQLSAPAAAPPQVISYHTVSEGENLWKIARQYKIKVDDLVRWNGLEKDRLRPGMKLRVQEPIPH